MLGDSEQKQRLIKAAIDNYVSNAQYLIAESEELNEEDVFYHEKLISFHHRTIDCLIKAIEKLNEKGEVK